MKLLRVKPLLFLLASAVLAGLLNAARCPDSFIDTDSCPIAAVQAVATSTPHWAVWFDWINWLPGLVFGVLFCAAALDLRQPRQRLHLIRYSLASGVIYEAAGPLFTAILVQTQDMARHGLQWLLPAGLITGAFGAFCLALALRFVSTSSQRTPAGRFMLWTTAIVGGMAGLAFVTAGFYGSQLPFAGWPIAFVLWQAPVGALLLRTLEAEPA